MESSFFRSTASPTAAACMPKRTMPARSRHEAGSKSQRFHSSPASASTAVTSFSNARFGLALHPQLRRNRKIPQNNRIFEPFGISLYRIENLQTPNIFCNFVRRNTKKRNTTYA
jgi:hypothetical protein